MQVNALSFLPPRLPAAAPVIKSHSHHIPTHHPPAVEGRDTETHQSQLSLCHGIHTYTRTYIYIHTYTYIHWGFLQFGGGGEAFPPGTLGPLYFCHRWEAKCVLMKREEVKLSVNSCVLKGSLKTLNPRTWSTRKQMIVSVLMCVCLCSISRVCMYTAL